jgi:3-hydroxyisobutyrate dehydrogenase-like beta-hydroxyacid dehydrogenase
MGHAMTVKELGHIGWLGIGNMGLAMARLLADAGAQLSVYNRTPEKAEPLRAHGAQVARTLQDLAGCNIVVTMLATGDVVEELLLGNTGLLSQPSAKKPQVVIDCSSISVETSSSIRERLESMGVAFIAAPVSGNPEVVASGNSTFVCSGPAPAVEHVRPLFLSMGKAASYVGEGELARVAKICHNVWLGGVSQALAEVLVLGQKAGLTREAFLNFLNQSAMGSAFTKGRTPSWVAMDGAPGFSPWLMRKDMDLGLDLAKSLEMPMPLSNAARDFLQALINSADAEADFTQGLMQQQARASGLEMKPEKSAGH